MSKTIRIIVDDGVATVAGHNNPIVCGNEDYEVEFVFDKAWDDHPVKTARFVYNGKTIDVVFEGTTVAVPKLRNTSKVSIGVYSGETKTTTAAVIRCIPSVLCPGGVPDEPTPDVYGQLVDLINTRVNRDGKDGQDGKDGEDGQDGGYYTPDMSENEDGTVTVSFTPSSEDMPEVDPFTFATGASSGVKIVPFSVMITDTTTYCMTAVQFAEIYQAYKDGMTLVATSGATVYYYLDYISETEVRFARGYNSSGGLTIDTITLTAQNISKASRITPPATKVVALTNTVVPDPATGSPTIGYISPIAPSEIVQAVSNGQTVVARVSFSNTVPNMYSSTIYTLTSVDQNSAVFSLYMVVDNDVRLSTFTIDANKVVTSKTVTISSKVSLPTPELVTDDTVITEAGYYYAYATFSSSTAIVHNFGMFYCDPAMASVVTPAVTVYAGVGARLTVSAEGKLTFQTVNLTANGTVVSLNYTDDTVGMYKLYLAKLS